MVSTYYVGLSIGNWSVSDKLDLCVLMLDSIHIGCSDSTLACMRPKRVTHDVLRSQPEPQVLEKPVVLQSVATNGRLFQFLVFQLNTTDLTSDTGVKNLVWLEEDQPLYDYAKVRPLIKKKVVQVRSQCHATDLNHEASFLTWTDLSSHLRCPEVCSF